MLTIENLTHVYGNGTRALDDVSLAIPKGMFGLLGPNGAGKSTLMRSIATLQTPTSGSIRFGDIDVVSEAGTAAPGARIPAPGFRRLSARLGLRHARPHGGAEGRLQRPRPQGDGRGPAAPGQPVARARQGAGRLLGRHAAALRHRPGPDRQPRTDHRRRADRGSGPGRTQPASSTFWPRSARMSSSSCRPISSATSPTCARAWRCWPAARSSWKAIAGRADPCAGGPGLEARPSTRPSLPEQAAPAATSSRPGCSPAAP
jgi:energy-coupling factor transporter ATP-binding protein EcfA2